MPTDLNTTVTISAPSGTLVMDTAPFELVAVGASGRTWRRRTVEGRYQHGHVLVGAVLAAESLTIHVRLRGATWVEVQNRYTELVEALSQFTYTVTVDMEGVVRTYTCEPGDIRLVSGDTLSKFHVMASMQEYLLTIPYEVNP